MSSPVPLSGTEVTLFTPASLANVVPTPKFRFRTPTELDVNKYQHLLTLEGLRVFPDELIRAEMLRVLEANWDAETYQKNKERLTVFWANVDQDVAVDPGEQTAVGELLLRCIDLSPLLRQMDADNRRFSQEAPGVALSMYLCGWSDFDCKFTMEASIVPLQTRLALRKELERLETQAQADKVEGVNPGLAYMQLTMHAFHLMALTKEEAKNSDAPSRSSDTPNGTRTNSRRDGASTPRKARSNSKGRRTRKT